MADTSKLIALAFAPSAIEGEAVNAFLALRRTGYHPATPVKEDDKATGTWNVKIPAKSFDCFFDAMTSYSAKPFYTFKVNVFRGRLIDRWDLQIKVFFDSNKELEDFSYFLDQIFKKL